MTLDLFVSPVDDTVYGAELSEDGVYRYRLWRTWGGGEIMAWVMLNPSTADSEIDDPTIRRCMSFAKREGYDGIEVINLYALRATKPKDLLGHPDPDGPLNIPHWDKVLTDHRIGMVVAGWGANAGNAKLTPSKALAAWSKKGWFCLGQTNAGHPRHPLYVAGDVEFEPLGTLPGCYR